MIALEGGPAEDAYWLGRGMPIVTGPAPAGDEETVLCEHPGDRSWAALEHRHDPEAAR